MIQLCNFMAILQLLAGLCLLFFYDDVLKSLIITRARKESLGAFEFIINYFQSSFSKEETERIRGFIDIEISPSGKESILPRFRNIVNNLGRFGFIFLLSLLFIASHESLDSKTYKYGYQWIGLACVLYIAVSIVVFRYRDKKWVKGYWKFIYGVVCLIPFIYLTFCNKEIYANNLMCLYGILSTFLIIPILSIVVYLYDERRCKSLYTDLYELKQETSRYAEWEVNGWRREYYLRLPNNLKTFLKPDDDSEKAQGEMRHFTQDRIHWILEKHKTKNFLFRKPLSNIFILIFSPKKFLFPVIFIGGYLFILYKFFTEK